VTKPVTRISSGALTDARQALNERMVTSPSRRAVTVPRRIGYVITPKRRVVPRKIRPPTEVSRHLLKTTCVACSEAACCVHL
jgi:hypothetical protein